MQVDPFDPDSPIKKTAIEYFPPDMFFVLRVVQLLRGIAQGAVVGHGVVRGAAGGGAVRLHLRPCHRTHPRLDINPMRARSPHPHA